jgi:hypothetical protein
MKTTAELYAELIILERLFNERQRVLDAIPDCPIHGTNCVPHALEWIKDAIGEKAA